MKVNLIVCFCSLLMSLVAVANTDLLSQLKTQASTSNELSKTISLKQKQIIQAGELDKLRKAWQASKLEEARLFEQLVQETSHLQYVNLLSAKQITTTGTAQCERIEPDSDCIKKAEQVALAEAAKQGGHYFIEATSNSLNTREQAKEKINTSVSFSESVSMTVKAQVLGFEQVESNVESNQFTSMRQAKVIIKANVAGQDNPALKQSLIEQAQSEYLPFLSSNEVANLNLQKIVKAAHQEVAFVEVEQGQFVFGSNSGSRNEQPISRVKVAGFFFGATEVSKELYNGCIRALVCSRPLYSDELSQPAVNVSWVEVVDEFIPWLSSETGHEFRLPTEVEWEFVAKKGRGTELLCKVANGNYDKSSCDDGVAKLAAIASFQPDKLGAFDVLGNAAEWTSSCWRFDHKQQTRANCTQAVIKGGSWYNKPYHLRPSARFAKNKLTKLDTLGFRLVLVE